MLIIDGGIDEVPEISEAQECVFVLQQISYYNDGLNYGVIEEQYADKIFGPGKWNKLGRYTTVNGIQIPVLKMVPGHGSSTPGTVNENSLQVTEPYRATSWKLPDSTGTVHSLGEFQKNATVLFFFQGHGCLHCAEQITAALREAQAGFIQVIREAVQKVIGNCPDTIVT